MNTPLCTHCGAPIVEPLNIDQIWMTVCSSCHTPHFLWNNNHYRNIPKPMLRLTPRFNIGQTREGVAIRYRQLGCMLLLILSVCWLYLFAVAFTDQIQEVRRLSLIVAWLVTGYLLAEAIFNHRIISLTAKVIRISDAPIPPIRNLILKNPIALKSFPSLLNGIFR